MVKMQFQVSVQDWMSDFSGEHKSAAYNDLLKGEGIRVYNFAPHIPQKNRHAECFMHTLMDKAEAMHWYYCLLSIPTLHTSFYLSLLNGLLSILQVMSPSTIK